MFRGILEDIYPTRCLVCEKKNSEYLCINCKREIRELESKNHFFTTDFGDTVYYYGKYTKGISTLIKKLKYNKKIPVGTIIAEFLSEIIIEKFKPTPSLIVPIPLSFNKLIRRGYNQCEIISREISIITEIPMETSFLRRKFEFFERDQVKLNRSERKENLDNSFYLSGKKLFAHSIILIDDVSTTGKTINVCKELILKFYPNIKIYPLVFAH